MAFERLDSAHYTQHASPTFVDNKSLYSVLDSLSFKANLLLEGPKGSGKTLAIASYCATRKLPALTVDCSEDLRRGQLVGTFVLRGEHTPFILGPLTTAIEVANELGQCVLILEEINTLTPQAQKILNPLTDWRRCLEVPEAQHVFRLKPEARLWVTGTMNSAGYAGVYSLNEDLKSRFRIVPVSYPSITDERAILDSCLAQEGMTPDANFTGKLLTLAQESRQKDVSYALSTRDLVQIMCDREYIGEPRALFLAAGKFEGTDRDWAAKRIKSIFGADLNKLAM